VREQFDDLNLELADQTAEDGTDRNHQRFVVLEDGSEDRPDLGHFSVVDSGECFAEVVG
jgi:hypothetical protein